MGNFSHRTANGVGQDYGYVQETLTASGGVSTPRRRLNTVGGLGTLVHDANGSLTQSGNRSFGFNAANQPVTLSSATDSISYTYGPDRNRVQKVQTQGGKTWSTVYAGSYERTRYTGSGNGTIWEERYPLCAGNRLIGTRMRITTAGVKTRRAEYYHEDALGSVEVVTDSSGFIMKRYQYDPFGQRRDITALGIIPADLLRDNPFNALMLRGYTGHEHMDELGLIHMNGRVYDALSGRFLSADPNIQAPYDTQSFNRYAYVKNNPLKYTDPSGYFFQSLFKKLKKYWQPLLAIAIAAFAPYAAWAVWGQCMTLSAFMASGAGFVTAVGSGFAAGMVSSGGDIRAGLLGAATAGAFWGVGATLGAAASLGKVVAHGVVGGVSSVAQGGKFMHGFLSAGFTEAFAPGIRSNFSSTAGQAAAAAVVGGTASAVGGGKFANGAVTGAFSYAFGSVANGMANGQSFGRAALDVAGKLWNLPNTAIGLVYGGMGHVIGEGMQAAGFWSAEPEIGFGNNAIEFTGNPFGGGGALTLGNTITWGAIRGDAYYNAFSTHEANHTMQGQFLGPLYLPANAVAMGASLVTSPWASMQRTVPGASALMHGKLNFMEGPLGQDKLY